MQSYSWYRRFIPNFTEVARPRKGSLAKSLRQIKDLRFSYSISGLTTGGSKLIVYIKDRCELLYPRGTNPLLKDTKQNCTATDKEVMPVVLAVEKFRGYLEGCLCIVKHSCG